MKSFNTLEERQIVKPTEALAASSDNQAAVPPRQLRDPKRAAMLSVLPGLGQLYNGETGKGLLFLGTSLANIALLSFLFFTEPVLKGFTTLLACFNAAAKIDLPQTLSIIHTGRAVTLVYLSLILSFVVYAVKEAYDHARKNNQGKPFARFFFGMPEATSGSYLFHFAITCSLLVMVILYVAPKPIHEQATEIELIQEEEVKPPPAPKPPKPKQEPPRAPEKKPEQQPVKPQAVKQPTPVAVAVPTDQPVADPVVQSSDPAPAAGSDAGASSNGAPGGTDGGGGGDGKDVDFGSYLAEMQRRIKKNWYPPRGEESKTVVLKFKIRKDGSVYGVKLVTSSGLSIVDQAAITAVKNSSPLPNLPAGSPDEIDIKFNFDYNVFNGRGAASAQ